MFSPVSKICHFVFLWLFGSSCTDKTFHCCTDMQIFFKKYTYVWETFTINEPLFKKQQHEVSYQKSVILPTCVSFSTSVSECRYKETVTDQFSGVAGQVTSLLVDFKQLFKNLWQPRPRTQTIPPFSMALYIYNEKFEILAFFSATFSFCGPDRTLTRGKVLPASRMFDSFPSESGLTDISEGTFLVEWEKPCPHTISPNLSSSRNTGRSSQFLWRFLWPGESSCTNKLQFLETRTKSMRQTVEAKVKSQDEGIGTKRAGNWKEKAGQVGVRGSEMTALKELVNKTKAKKSIFTCASSSNPSHITISIFLTPVIQLKSQTSSTSMQNSPAARVS